MRTVTALHPERRDRVRVELDGAPWRTLPSAAVVSAGLRVGTALDRERARELGRAMRRAGALDTAARALARRDRSPAGLEALLEQRGIAASDRTGAVETMERLGYVDERRFAERRAASLAARGYGDEAIRFDLEREGVGGELVAEAIEGLVPELARARAVLSSGGRDPKALRRLAAKGFSADALEALLGPGDL
jgi:SOS response regulatory protein OraA/RecX